MVEVRWTLGSRDDLRSIWTYVAQDSKARADRLIGNLRSHPERLRTHPLSGKPVPEVGRASIRELLYGSYRIIYLVVNATTVDILAVHHGKRILPKTLLRTRLKRAKGG